MLTDTASTGQASCPVAAAPPASAGYANSFTGTSAGQGIVPGHATNHHAIPVVGASATKLTYLTGNYGSAQTTSASSAGNTFFTGGPGQIAFDWAYG